MELKKSTLEYALRAGGHAIPMEELREKHPAVLDIVTLILGVTPRCDQYLGIWPPAFETYNVFVPNLFAIPFSDFGVGAIPTSLRSITAYSSSRAFGCGYCSAHTAVMGDIWSGHGGTLEKNAKITMTDPSSSPTSASSIGTFDAREEAAIAVGKCLGQAPIHLTSRAVTASTEVFSLKEEEAVVNAATVMGFLNFFMSATGMPLERDAIETSTAKLSGTGWEVGQHFDPKVDWKLMEEDEEDMKIVAQRPKGFFAWIKTVFGAKMADNKALSAIPSSAAGIYTRCKRDAGFVPFYLRQMTNLPAKRALAYGFLLRLLEGTDEVPARVKQIMAYVSATNTGNTILRAHYAFLACELNDATPAQLLDAVQQTSHGWRKQSPTPPAHVSTASLMASIAPSYKASSAPSPSSATSSATSFSTSTTSSSSASSTSPFSLSFSAKERVAIAFAHATSFAPILLSADLITAMMEAYSPSAVIELVLTLSVHTALDRWTSFYAPVAYEPELEAFVESSGAVLGLPPVATGPSTPEQRERAMERATSGR